LSPSATAGVHNNLESTVV